MICPSTVPAEMVAAMESPATEPSTYNFWRAAELDMCDAPVVMPVAATTDLGVPREPKMVAAPEATAPQVRFPEASMAVAYCPPAQSVGSAARAVAVPALAVVAWFRVGMSAATMALKA